MITVVDSKNFINNYSSQEYLKNTSESLGEDDERAIIDLMVEQIEFANVIIMNKVSECSEKDIKTVESIIKGLNVDADIIKSNFSKVDTNKIIGVKKFNLEEAENHPLWSKELFSFKEHIPETEEYGIKSFVYTSIHPFHPERIMNFFNNINWPGIIRAKGVFWLATRPDYVGEMSQAGALVRHQGIGLWWASLPEDERPESEDFEQMVKDKWNDISGDRRQELVFIGLKDEIDESYIRAELDKCLLSDYWDNKNKYNELYDPFPKWFLEESEHVD